MTGIRTPTAVSLTPTGEIESEAFSPAFKLPAAKEVWAILEHETFGALSAGIARMHTA